MSFLIETRNLVKQFRGVRAVDGISFEIAPGRCFGLLGPNGAGKTTTVEMLEGIIRPTEGEILYRGEPLGRRFRAEAGIMFQNTALQEFITVRESLAMFARLYEHTLPMQKLIDDCALDEFLDRDTRKISGGQRQRLLLAVALINDPAVVFLDEPTTGLDPQSRRRFWELVRGIRDQGKTVVLTTHYMEEAYELCDEIAIMDHGHIIARGTPSELLAAHYNDVILQLPQQVLPASLELGGVVRHARGQLVELSTPDVEATIAALIRAQVPLSHLRIRSRTLEDLFIELTGRELRA